MSNGLDPYGYIRQVAVEMKNFHDPAQIETVLDELEYLYEAMDPQLRDLADDLMEKLRQRLDQVR